MNLGLGQLGEPTDLGKWDLALLGCLVMVDDDIIDNIDWWPFGLLDVAIDNGWQC